MSAALPLLGVRVIELCWVWSGPLLGQFLADLGAEVIKVEWFKRYDLYRTRGVGRMAGKYPEFIRREMSHSFHGLNRNKIGLALDLKEGQHREALLDLVGQSDLVIENFTAGTLDRLGLGYDAMAKANPAIMLHRICSASSMRTRMWGQWRWRPCLYPPPSTARASPVLVHTMQTNCFECPGET